MAQCTAPIHGHRTASGRDNCPACGGRGGYRYSYPSYSSLSYSSSSYSSSSGGSGRSGGGGSSRTTRAPWSRPGSGVLYTPAEIRALTPVRENVEKRAILDVRDMFLCHAWDDRQGAAAPVRRHFVQIAVFRVLPGFIAFSIIQKDRIAGSQMIPVGLAHRLGVSCKERNDDTIVLHQIFT